MQATELVGRKLNRHPDPAVNAMVAGAAGTVDEAAIAAFFGGERIEDLPADLKADVARKLWIRLQDWSPVMGGIVAPVTGTPVNAATLAAIIDRLEA